MAEGQLQYWAAGRLTPRTPHQYPSWGWVTSSTLQASCRLRRTHGIEEHCEEQLAPIDNLVQLAGATRVLVVEDSVCEEATRLPWEDLGDGESGCHFSRSRLR